MATNPVPANIAAALRYGPQTQTTLRRSQYLADALRQLQETGGQNIQSPAELGAKLLASAILQRKSEKADAAATGAIKADQDAYRKSALADLGASLPSATAAPPAQVQTPQPAQPPAPQSPQQQPVALPSAQAAPAPVDQLNLNPDIDKLVRTVWGEARGEDPLGQLGVANVVINRAKRGGKSITDIVLEPNQFEPWSNPKTRAQLESLTPDSADYQRIFQNIAPALQGQDITSGADHFYSPSAQAAAGRAPPRWDDGSGVDHGRHRFFNLGYGGQGAHQRQAPSEMFQPQQQVQQPPVQVAMNGQIDPQALQASASFGPSGGGAAPVAPNAPQAAATGANQWPNYKPSQSEIQYVDSLLSDPRTYDQGVSEYQKLRQKMTQPAEADIQTINGVPFYVSKVPGQGGQPVMIPIPQGAMTQTVSAQQAGLPTAPQGAYVQRDPLGNLKEAPFAPPEGYNAGPNGYSPIAGGPADPRRVQAPPTGYQLQGSQYTAIPGGPADPRAPSNYIAEVGKLQQQIRPVVDQAIQLKRNIDAVRTGYQQNNGPGDIAMTNGIQKLIDEGVVREGDVNLQMKAQGLNGTFGQWQQYLSSKGVYTPQVRQQVAATAEALYGSINNNYRDRVLGYREMTNRLLGGNAFEDVFPSSVSQSLGWAKSQGASQTANAPAPNPAVVATPGTRAAAIAEAKRRGLIK